MRLSYFLNDRYNVLKYLKENEVNSNGVALIKTSQDKIAKELHISKHKINTLVNELIELKAIEKYDEKGKYILTTEANEMLDQTWKIDAKKTASNYQCASFFAGVGGIDLGFEKAGFKTVYANELDPKAVKTYELNFPIKVDNRDICEVTRELESGIDFCSNEKINILLAGFPCQAFSIAGYREGFEDKKGRGGLFFEIMKIIKNKQPEIVFLENVKNLQSHDGGKTFEIIEGALKSQKYFIRKDVLNSMKHGNVPQNRERIYIVAFKDEDKSKKFKFPDQLELSNTLDKVLDFDTKVEDRFYYTKDSFKHYETLKNAIVKKDTLYQWRRVYVRENKSNVCPTLTANMGTGGHNVPLVLTKHGIRKLLPKECFELQGFPPNYRLPNDMALSYLYKQSGNSVSVSVIERIANEILKVL